MNQKGEDVFDDNINCLTVITNESFEDYAKALQTDIERDTGIEFGRLLSTAFSKIISPFINNLVSQEESGHVYKEL